MKILKRKIGLLVAALVLAAALVMVVGSPWQTNASCEGDVSWKIHNVIDDSSTTDTKGGKTTDTQSISSRTEQNSNNGQSITDNQTHYTNADGSSHEHEDIYYSDSEGKRCDSDGMPMTHHHTKDDDTDSKGNTKEHIEEIEEKNGKCVKSVRDFEWNAKGKLIKDTGWVDTEIPCSKYNLRVNFKGTKSLANMTATYGPNNIIVHLEDKGKIYEGKYESVLDGRVSGSATAPSPGW
jgi:hypothetical protein